MVLTVILIVYPHLRFYLKQVENEPIA